MSDLEAGGGVGIFLESLSTFWYGPRENVQPVMTGGRVGGCEAAILDSLRS